MKYLFSFFLIAASVTASAQHFQAYTADKLMKRVSNKDSIYIVNFWATWCAPCVKELPAFDTLQMKYAGKKVKVLLVSFDFKEDYQQKLSAFVKKKGTKPEIVWFSDTNANDFIPKIDNRWSGGLPATMVIYQDKKIFKESTIEAGEIETIVNTVLK